MGRKSLPLNISTFYIGEETLCSDDNPKDVSGFEGAGFTRRQRDTLIGRIQDLLGEFSATSDIPKSLMGAFPEKIPVYIRNDAPEDALLDEEGEKIVMAALATSSPLSDQPLNASHHPTERVRGLLLDMTPDLLQSESALESMRDSVLRALIAISLLRSIRSGNESRHQAFLKGILNRFMGNQPGDVLTPHIATTTGLSVPDDCNVLIEEDIADLFELIADDAFDGASLKNLWKICSELMVIHDRQGRYPLAHETDDVIHRVLNSRANDILNGPAFQETVPGVNMIALISRETSTAFLNTCDISKQQTDEIVGLPKLVTVKSHWGTWEIDDIDEKRNTIETTRIADPAGNLIVASAIEWLIEPKEPGGKAFYEIRSSGQSAIIDRRLAGEFSS